MYHTLDLILRLITAGVLGALIGFERKAHLKDAGLRTHFILAIGASLIMIVSKYGFQDMYGLPSVSFDPSRIAAQVVSGIGFLGAGMIIFRRNTVLGLTTATALWATAGVGLASGAGLYMIAVAGTALILIGLTLLKTLEHRFIGRIRQITIVAKDRTGLLGDIDSMLELEGFKVERMSISRAEENAGVQVELVVRIMKASKTFDDVRTTLVHVEGVEKVEIPHAF